MPTGFIQLKPETILQLEAMAPVYQNKYNGFIYVTEEQRNKPGIYEGISNRKINAMIKEGYAIKEKDGAVIRSAKGMPAQAYLTQPPVVPTSDLDGWDKLPYLDRLDLAHDVRHGPTVLSPEDLKLVYDWVWDLHAELVADIKRLIANYETQS